MYIQNVFTKGVVSMAKTQAVNFRADSVFYQKTKDILADEKLRYQMSSMQHLEKLLIGQLMQENLFLVICKIHSIKWLLRI